MGLLTDFITFVLVLVSFMSLRKNGMRMWHVHLTLFGGMFLFGPLLVLESYEKTGIFWLPVMPMLTFMLAGSHLGMRWGWGLFRWFTA
ncbi:MAG: hypothetical protein R8K49_06735 [Mariprofundaceae bacterium]